MILRLRNLMKDLAISEMNYDIFSEDPDYLEEIIMKAWNTRIDLKNTIKMSYSALARNNFSPDIVDSLLGDQKFKGLICTKI